ncbi:MAG TPA: HD domain-containing protein [Methylococcales bacterium]
MRTVQKTTITDVIELSTLLGEFGQIKRVTLLPNGEQEPDSHHSFSLALIAYELACQYAPELNPSQVLLYGLVHDLPELVTGDVVTLTATTEELDKKADEDALAIAETEQKFAAAPNIVVYEAKSNDEALFVYWIDKMITIPTHFYDNGTNLHKLGIKNQQDIRQWYERTLTKLHKQTRKPHDSAVSILELAYTKMHDELLETNNSTLTK